MSFLNNSKNNTADSNDEDDVLKAEKWCADFKKNPLKALLLFCIWIVLIAICAKTVWEHYLIGWELLKTAKGGIAEFVLILSFCMIFKQSAKLFKGSEHDAAKFLLRAVGVIMFCASILTAIIAGPATSGYGWMEDEAKSYINEEILNKDPIECTEVSINKKSNNTYYGKASFSNGTTKNVVATFLLLESHRRAIAYKVKVNSY